MKIKYKRKDNNFSQETRELFRDAKFCWKCGKNNWDAAHHILSGEYSDSPLNLCPIHNYPCHIAGGHHFSKEETIGFLSDTLEYLFLHNYKPTNHDKAFIRANLDDFRAFKLGSQLIKRLNIKI